MARFHITPDLLEAVERGELPARILTEVGWSHLRDLCPTCREGFGRWQRRRQPARSAYESTFRVLPLLLERQAGKVALAQEEAERDLAELLRFDHETRLRRIGRARSRFKGVMLAELLLAEVRGLMPASPASQYQLAEAAEAVLIRTASSLGYYDALARAMAHKANALRAMGRMREADKRMESVRALIRQNRVVDTLVYAEVDWLEGVLRKDQRRFVQAEELLARAASLYRLHGEDVEAARPLLALGAMHYHQRQDLAQALDATEAALSVLSLESEPLLYLCARHNLALFLVDAGEHHEAAQMIAADEELYRQFADPGTQFRKTWLLGKIAFGAGRFGEAETAFLAVRAGFVAEGIGYDAAVVSLDLALLYLKQGRPAELRELSEQIHRLFASEDIHREAMAALVLFEEAARLETATVELVEELAAYLQRARENPELCFRRRSSQPAEDGR